MSDDLYCYPPDYTVLRNKAALRDATALDRFERRMVRERMLEALPKGDFDLAHLAALHRHLFQDVYDWAGEVRRVEIAKGGSQFQFRQYIVTGVQDVHRRIRAHDYLRNLDADAFADLAGEILGDINYVHPFRDGNGRTQLLYLQQLGKKAGHRIDLLRLEKATWMAASKAAHQGDYTPMAACIRASIT